MQIYFHCAEKRNADGNLLMSSSLLWPSCFYLVRYFTWGVYNNVSFKFLRQKAIICFRILKKIEAGVLLAYYTQSELQEGIVCLFVFK